MIRQLAASHVAKTLALCVCPVVTSGVIATKEPHIRRMIHNATANERKSVTARKRAALSNVSLPPCTPVAPFAALPRIAAALPAAVGLPGEQQGLTRTAAPESESNGSSFNPGFGAPGAIGLGPSGGFLGGGGGGGGVIPPGGGGGGTVVPPPGGGGGTVVVTPPPGPISGVPEPETWLQVLSGLAIAGGGIRYYRIRRRAAAIA